jgi:hypothetical protein
MVIYIINTANSTAWYAVIQSAKIVVGFFQRAQQLRVIFVFVDPPMLALFYFVFLLFFVFWA